MSMRWVTEPTILNPKSAKCIYYSSVWDYSIAPAIQKNSTRES